MKTKIVEKAYIHDDEYYYSVIRKNIKRLRLEHNYTQQVLADKIEMSRGYICDVENEHRYKHPTIAVVGRIAEAFNVNIAELFYIDENDK